MGSQQAIRLNKPAGSYVNIFEEGGMDAHEALLDVYKLVKQQGGADLSKEGEWLAEHLEAVKSWPVKQGILKPNLELALSIIAASTDISRIKNELEDCIWSESHPGVRSVAFTILEKCLDTDEFVTLLSDALQSESSSLVLGTLIEIIGRRKFKELGILVRSIQQRNKTEWKDDLLGDICEEALDILGQNV